MRLSRRESGGSHLSPLTPSPPPHTLSLSPSPSPSQGSGVIAVTGASASLRGKPFTAAFAPSKAAQRMLAQSLARDLGPKGVHVFYAVIDGLIGSAGGDTGEVKGTKLDPDAIAEQYWNVARQPASCWTQELDLRPAVERW